MEPQRPVKGVTACCINVMLLLFFFPPTTTVRVRYEPSIYSTSGTLGPLCNTLIDWKSRGRSSHQGRFLLHEGNFLAEALTTCSV